MSDTQAKAARAQEIAAQIGPILRGLGPDVQGAVLADLTATWLAGFQGLDAEEARVELLEDHIRMVRKLIPLNEKIILDRLAEGTRK